MSKEAFNEWFNQSWAVPETMGEMVERAFHAGYSLAEKDNVEQNAKLEAMVDKLLDHCPDGECLTCGSIVCPDEEPLHFHHDGCPVCAVAEQIYDKRIEGSKHE